jgi:GT2 family glycosyltransferase/glycosyltransferase involved in cell wall biosynthesis
MAFLKRLLRALPSILLSPVVFLVSIVALAAADFFWFVFGRRDRTASTAPDRTRASVVIPNWNGRDLLEKYLPSVIEAMGGNEIIVVDNGSSDGSAEFVRATFPSVTVLALPENLGFGGGSNAGFRAATNDVVVLLNSDMRVAPDFLAPLLEGFADPDVFAVSCQIFFSDPNKVREETGLTQAWWQDGMLRVRHRIDDRVTDLFPCFYGGGGSCAFDRRKFLELGGFDHLLAPFYLEDTDLGYLAWKRGWKVLYQPRSVVFHEHRGTIGKKFSYAYIQSVLNKNFLLFCQKNIHEWGKLGPHFAYTWMNAMLAVAFGDAPLRPNFAGMWRAFRQLPGAMRSRWRSRSLARVSDSEAFRRPLGGYYRDRFDAMEEAPERLRVLFVSPYPICPPVHGGGVFMYQTLRRLTPLAETHVVELLDWPWQEQDNLELREICASAEFLVRPSGDAPRRTSLLPHAVEEHAIGDLEWAIHRQIYLKKIDVVQLEYTPLAQFRCEFRRIAQALFEHDVYFQSIGRALGKQFGVLDGMKARMEYLRAIRYELGALPGFDQVQLCTPANREYLLSFRPELAARLAPGLRAGIDTSRYEFRTAGREPYTMLFVGSFKHEPNRVAMEWFTGQVMPHILARQPKAKLVVAGSDPPPAHAFPDYAGSLELLGFVDDVRDVLAKYAVFVCPILNGSGVRVKLLEAYAAGMPVVSTAVGAEGLIGKEGEFCLTADDPAAFADKVAWLFENPEAAAAMTERARAEVEANWDMAAITRKLADGYRELVKEKRRATSAASSDLS